MRDLDNICSIEKYDVSCMQKLLEDFPEQCRDARGLAEEFVLPEEFGRIGNIVTCGMGGSAINGDLLRAIYGGSCSVPITVNRNYSIPGFVNKHTLFIATSYSGNTEETLAAFESAVERKAKAVAITSGGKLKAYCKENEDKGVLCLLIPELKTNKGERIQPRCAFGYLFIPLVVFLSKINLVGDQGSSLDAAIEQLSDTMKELSPDKPAKDNEAKQIAQLAYSKQPVIYASQKYDAVAMRWKAQFNENSEVMAFYNVIPEMNHNEIVGWGLPRDMTRRSLVIMLKDEGDDERINKRIDITRRLIAEEGAHVIPVEPQGDSLLARSLYFIYLGDFASYYLAILNGIDPTPVKRIEQLKRDMVRN